MISLKQKFSSLKKQGRKAFIAYIPFGFPNIKATKSICLALEESGVDVIELGIPFSDPLADGPIIQKATSWALKKGANIENLFKTLKALTKAINIPLVIMTYYNPIFNFGLDKFLKKIKQLGVSAITIVDLPLEEAKEYINKAKKLNLETVFFVTPTTSLARTKRIAKVSKGFVYYISVTGITGPKNFSYKVLAQDVKAIKKVTKLPVCVGFGIHNRSQVSKINTFADGVIVGSSIVEFIENNHSKKNFIKGLKTYIRSLLS
jgi:tryptophan synthase alpha chain